jgi:nicotinamidase-related amidase
MTGTDKKETRALVVVDVQNDFCPGGALPVAGGDAVVPVVNRLMSRFRHAVLTQDWHPPGHVSFASSHPGTRPHDGIELAYGKQLLWPDHCVRGTDGAAFHPALSTASAELVVRKGFRRELDSYSAFFENDKATPTGLAGYLRARGLTDLYFAGLATDFCVRDSALDAARLGFSVHVVEEGCRGIDIDGSLEAAWQAMASSGVERLNEDAILGEGGEP